MKKSVRHPGGKTIVLALILLGWFVFSSAPVAQAHAILESSTPADQSVVKSAPSEVVLDFSESVTANTGAIKVFDSSGKRVDVGIAAVGPSPSQVHVRLKSDLAKGSYAVTWRVISADTHPVHGGFIFSIGQTGSVGALSQYTTQSSQRGWEAAGIVLRALGYLGSFVVVGAAFFAAFIVRDVAQREQPSAWLSIAGFVAVLVTVAQIPVAAALATGEGLGSLTSPGVAKDVLGHGFWFTVAGLAVAVVFALLSLRSRDRIRDVLVLAALAFLAGGFAASGHTRSAHQQALMIVVDATHVIAGVIWVGGLFALILSVRAAARSRRDPAVSAQFVARFSTFAGVSIVAVGVAGTIMALIEIGSISQLFDTGYGQLVVTKIVLVMVLAALGAFNRFRLVPAIRTKPDHSAAWKYLGRAIRFEAVAMVAILGVTGALVNAIPSRTVAERATVYSHSEPLGSGSANLVIDPERTGPITLHLYLLDAHGRVDNTAQSVTLSMEQPKLGIGPVDRLLQKAGPGHYATNAMLFSVPGTWQITVQVRVDEFDQTEATFPVTIRD